MRETAGRMSWKDWVAVGGGLLIASILMAQLIYTLAWGGALGASPGLFVLGTAVLVMVVGIGFDRAGKHPQLNWIVGGLVIAAIVLSVGGLLLA